MHDKESSEIGSGFYNDVNHSGTQKVQSEGKKNVWQKLDHLPHT